MKCAEETTAQTISKEAQDIVRKLFDKVKHNYFDPPTTATTEVTLIITNIHSATRIVHRLHDNSCGSS